MNHDPVPGVGGTEDRVLAVYEERLSGIPAILLDSAKETMTNGVKGVVVPDPEGLQVAVAVARATLSQKLAGSEIRALRKAVGMQARDLASFLDVTPETVSKWENGHEPISTNPERLFRIRVCQQLRSKAPGVPVKTEDIVSMRPSFRLANHMLALRFERAFIVRDGTVERTWVFRGVKEEIEVPAKQTA